MTNIGGIFPFLIFTAKMEDIKNEEMGYLLLPGLSMGETR